MDIELDDIQPKHSRKPGNFIRLGKTRQNRPLLMSHVNKRNATLESDYDSFLEAVCVSLLLPKDEIDDFVRFNIPY